MSLSISEWDSFVLLATHLVVLWRTVKPKPSKTHTRQCAVCPGESRGSFLAP